MSYDKQTWSEGISADRLNHIEEGISKNSIDNETLLAAITALDQRVSALESDTQPPVVLPSDGLFFDASEIQKPGVFEHLMLPHLWPYTIRSWYNEATEAEDWYSKAMNNPDHKDFASSKKWGGDSRARPMFRPKISGSTSEWTMVDRKFDIQTALQYGCDGFFADIINTWKPRTTEWANALRSLREEESEKYENFVIIPMIDANSSGAYSPTDVAAEYVMSFSDVTKWVDGVMLWAVWHPGARDLSVWEDISDHISNNGIPNKMVGCWNSSYTSSSNGPSAYAHLTFGEGPWGAGTADPVNIEASTDTIESYLNSAHSRGKIFLHPARAAETRPSSKGPWYDEPNGTRALEAQWKQIVEIGSDWVQPITWSDWTEDTSFAPGTHYGYARLLLNAYLVYRWKIGSFPDILTDAVILSHRQHLLNAEVTYSGQTDKLPQRTNSPKTAPQDTVEALVWLTDPATVRIIDGSGTTDFQAPAGMSRYNKPLVVGKAPKVEIHRNDSKVTEVQSTQAILDTPWRTDWTYWQFTNLHSTEWQHRIPGPNPPYE